MAIRLYDKIKEILGLSFQVAKAEFKMRNEGSYLGLFWYVLGPILTTGLLFLIFYDRLGSNIPLYGAYLFLGVIIFNLFESSTIEAATSIVRENPLLIKSINFRKEALISAIVLKNLFSHLFEIILFCIVLLIYSGSMINIIYYPLILVAFCIFTFGASLILASLAVYFVDIINIWKFLIKLVWLGTPIFYAIENQKNLYSLNLFNPLYYFITAAREMLIYQNMPEASIFWGILVFTALSLAIGSLIFNKLKIKMAELI